jgi:hypothetical protein
MPERWVIFRQPFRTRQRFVRPATALRFLPFSKAQHRMNPTIRIVTRGSNGELRTKDYEKHDTVLKMHTQIGIDDCSTDLSLRGLPVFRGLIGPMPEGKGVVRYETPEVFETLTKEWSTVNTSRSRRRRTTAS